MPVTERALPALSDAVAAAPTTVAFAVSAAFVAVARRGVVATDRCVLRYGGRFIVCGDRQRNHAERERQSENQELF